MKNKFLCCKPRQDVQKFATVPIFSLIDKRLLGSDPKKKLHSRSFRATAYHLCGQGEQGFSSLFANFLQCLMIFQCSAAPSA